MSKVTLTDVRAQVKKLYIDWMLGYGNDPYLRVVFKAKPDFQSIRWHAHPFPGGTLYYGVDNVGLVHQQIHMPANEWGSGGSRSVLRMADGSRVEFRGPWSGNSGNLLDIGLEVKDCAYSSPADQNGTFPSWYAIGYIPVETVRAIVPTWVDVSRKPDDWCYRITLRGYTNAESKELICKLLRHEQAAREFGFRNVDVGVACPFWTDSVSRYNGQTYTEWYHNMTYQATNVLVRKLPIVKDWLKDQDDPLGDELDALRLS